MSYPARLVSLERFVLKETRIELPPTWRFYPARLVRLERFVFKETTHTAVPHVDSLSGATWVVTISRLRQFFLTESESMFIGRFSWHPALCDFQLQRCVPQDLQWGWLAPSTAKQLHSSGHTVQSLMAHGPRDNPQKIKKAGRHIVSSLNFGNFARNIYTRNLTFISWRPQILLPTKSWWTAWLTTTSS